MSYGTKEERLEKANEFIKTIASCGHKFFNHEGFISYFEFDDCRRIYFIDHYTKKMIYTHYKGLWRGFTNGGTLKTLIELLRDYISTGWPMKTTLLGPWSDSCCKGDLWGYGEDMEIVRKKAYDLQIWEGG